MNSPRAEYVFRNGGFSQSLHGPHERSWAQNEAKTLGFLSEVKCCHFVSLQRTIFNTKHN